MKDPKVEDLPKNFVCPCCETEFEYHTKITGHVDQPVHKGMIIVCCNCAAVLEVGDFGVHKMSKAKLNAQSDDVKGVLKSTVAAVLANNLRNQPRG